MLAVAVLLAAGIGLLDLGIPSNLQPYNAPFLRVPVVGHVICLACPIFSLEIAMIEFRFVNATGLIATEHQIA